MRAAWYESQGDANKVLVVGEMEAPLPGPGQVRIRVERSGVNPGDVKKRSDAFGIGMPYRRVIPHSDGSGIVDMVGAGVSPNILGERVWCFGAQSYRPFGTAAEFTVIPLDQTRVLASSATWEQGACLGIPGMTAHRAVFAGGEVEGRTVLVQAGSGAVGMAAVAMAVHAGAHVITTVRNAEQVVTARKAGASDVLQVSGIDSEGIAAAILGLAPEGVDHVVEVAFQANIHLDEKVLKPGGSIASYATNEDNASLPFWNLAFKNARLYFLGSDDFTFEQKQKAADDLSEMLAHGWSGYPIARVLPLREIAAAHELVEQGGLKGRVIIDLSRGA